MFGGVATCRCYFHHVPVLFFHRGTVDWIAISRNTSAAPSVAALSSPKSRCAPVSVENGTHERCSPLTLNSVRFVYGCVWFWLSRVHHNRNIKCWRYLHCCVRFLCAFGAKGTKRHNRVKCSFLKFLINRQVKYFARQVKETKRITNHCTNHDFWFWILRGFFC